MGFPPFCSHIDNYRPHPESPTEFTLPTNLKDGGMTFVLQGREFYWMVTGKVYGIKGVSQCRQKVT